MLEISIHAPHAGRDFKRASVIIQGGISIHAPHAGRDAHWFWPNTSMEKFQSTRPMRGATANGQTGPLDPVISIHAPHAGRDIYVGFGGRINAISIHAPHAGRDLKSCHRDTGHPKISIHAPHAGRDAVSPLRVPGLILFQSTRPMRGATSTLQAGLSTYVFQSTRPMRGATQPRGIKSP